MISPASNEGLRGLQNSQREITRAASDIAQANVSRPVDAAPVSASSPEQLSSPLAPVGEPARAEPDRNLTESLVELRRQELLFNASAQVLRTDNAVQGTLLDTQA